MVDAWWEDAEAAPAATSDARPPERELLDEGEHRLKIVRVLNGSDTLEVRLAHDDRRFGWVFCRMPKNAGWAKRLAKSLADALAIPAAQWEPAIDAGDLTDRMVIARVYHKVSGARTYVNVGDFKPVDELVQAEPGLTVHHVETFEPPKSVAKRTATQKADAAARMPGDDIPF